MAVQAFEPVHRTAQTTLSRMIDVDKARERILAAFAPLPMVRVPLAEALGHVLAVDVIAGASVPAFANAAMDGFAVRASDTALASRGQPVTLRVIAEAAAGHGSETPVIPGTAVRIMTGAPIPPGADSVVRFEETEEGDGGTPCVPGATVEIYAANRPGQNVRPIGEDVTAGETVLACGTRIRPVEIGVLATLNRTHATVYRKPRVGVLATGDEIIDAGEPLGPGQIRNSNAPMIAAMVRRCGGEPVTLGIARDTAGDLGARLAAANGLDLLLTTGASPSVTTIWSKRSCRRRGGSISGKCA